MPGHRETSKLVDVGSDTAREAIHPVGVHRELGAWTHAVVTRPGAESHLVFVSGQTSVDRAGQVVGAEDFEAQFRQVYANLREVTRASGGSVDSIVSLRTYLTRRDDIERFRELRDQLHAELYPRGDYPTHTLVLVSGLALPELLLEVEAVLAI
jgi:enamine deaminase RidA (YjgF/YER057c/UK114 family)